MAQQQSITASGAVGSVTASSLETGGSNTTVLDDFEDWPGENALAEFASAGRLENGGGSGEVEDGALRLEYDDAGWFLCNVRADVSDYDVLELDVRGDDGGEGQDVRLQVGSVTAPLSELADGTVGTETSTLSVDLQSLGVDLESLQDVWLTFWRAGSGAIEIERIRFYDGESDEDPCAEHGAHGEQLSNGDWVCDLDGDGNYRDLTASGDTTTQDLQHFFERQHRDPWDSRTDLFDFTGNDDVGQPDVVDLFHAI